MEALPLSSIQLICSSLGATRVVVFSTILRNDSRDTAEQRVKSDPTMLDDNAPIEDVVPARFVHIDQSETGAREVLRDNIHPTKLAEKLGKTRWSIINVWRPIKPVYKVRLNDNFEWTKLKSMSTGSARLLRCQDS